MSRAKVIITVPRFNPDIQQRVWVTCILKWRCGEPVAYREDDGGEEKLVGVEKKAAVMLLENAEKEEEPELRVAS